MDMDILQFIVGGMGIFGLHFLVKLTLQKDRGFRSF
jgi:hypothetical protein